MSNKKFDFISGIDQENISPKTKYQLFDVEMGFEKAQVLIPMDQADLFEEEAVDLKPKSKTALTALAKKFGGTII